MEVCELYQNLVKINGNINAAYYEKMLEDNLHLSAWKMCMGLIMNQNIKLINNLFNAAEEK